MYCIKYFESLFQYEKNGLKDVVYLDFPKTTKNFLFKIKVDKDGNNTFVETEKCESCEKDKLTVIDGTKSLLSKFLSEVFKDQDVEIYGLCDGKEFYIIDIFFNDRWFVQEDIDEFAKEYKFKTLETIYTGKFDEKELDNIKKPMLIKSRFELDLFTNNADKNRFVIFKRMEK